VTESKWIKCGDLRLMLASQNWRATSRQLRLFACAVCRRYWHLLSHEQSRHAVLTAERFIDGVATAEELAAVQEEARIVGKWHDDGLGPATCCWEEDFTRSGAQETADQMLMVLEDECYDGEMSERQYRAENRALAELLREIVGNPFRPVSHTSGWLVWNNAAVVHLAHGIYDDRAFERLPILADALEEVGCTDAAILAHCRDPGPHVRGCWVVDLLLGKE
jgi:hypothetical protein